DDIALLGPLAARAQLTRAQVDEGELRQRLADEWGGRLARRRRRSAGEEVLDDRERPASRVGDEEATVVRIDGDAAGTVTDRDLRPLDADRACAGADVETPDGLVRVGVHERHGRRDEVDAQDEPPGAIELDRARADLGLDRRHRLE